MPTTSAAGRGTPGRGLAGRGVDLLTLDESLHADMVFVGDAVASGMKSGSTSLSSTLSSSAISRANIGINNHLSYSTSTSSSRRSDRQRLHCTRRFDQHQSTPQKDVRPICIRATPHPTTRYIPGREIRTASIGLALMRAEEASCALQEDAETLVRQEWAILSRVSSTRKCPQTLTRDRLSLLIEDCCILD
ncbi:hypothetical protein KCU83_g521, partial [Aureobasidium melanogenum]